MIGCGDYPEASSRLGATSGIKSNITLQLHINIAMLDKYRMITIRYEILIIRTCKKIT